MGDITRTAVRAAGASIGLAATDTEAAWTAARDAREAGKTAGEERTVREAKAFTAAISAVPPPRQLDFSTALAAALAVPTGTSGSSGGTTLPGGTTSPGGTTPPDPAAEKSTALTAAQTRADTARTAAKKAFDDGVEEVRKAKGFADEAERLGRGSAEAQVARDAADQAASVTTTGTAPDTIQAQLDLATRARDTVRGIVRAGGDVANAKNGANDAEEARDEAQKLLEQAQNAARAASDALDDLKRVGKEPDSKALAWLKDCAGILVVLAIALVATFIVWGLGAPGMLVLAVILVILAIAGWSFFSHAQQKPEAPNGGSSRIVGAAVILMVLAIAAAFFFYGVGGDGGNGGDDGDDDTPTDQVDCWLDENIDHPDCKE